MYVPLDRLFGADVNKLTNDYGAIIGQAPSILDHFWVWIHSGTGVLGGIYYNIAIKYYTRFFERKHMTLL